MHHKSNSIDPQYGGSAVLASSKPLALNNMRIKLKGGEKLPNPKTVLPEKSERAERLEKLERKEISPYWSSRNPDPAAELYRVVF